MTSAVDVRVPDIGDFKNILVMEVLVSVGSRIQVDTPLLTLESDKATLEVPAPLGGTVEQIVVCPGERISRGDLILKLVPELATANAGSEITVERSSRDIGERGPPIAVEIQGSGISQTRAESKTLKTDERCYAGPAARALSRLLNVDLGAVVGTGPRGRILKEDVQRYFKGSATLETPHRPAPVVDFTRFGAVDRRPLSRIQKISGAHLARNWATIPHVTNFDEADITALEEFREGINENADVKVTLLAFLIKTCALTLSRFPAFNASLDGDEVVLKQYCHIGFAVDTPDGLLVPVIRDVLPKGLIEIARDVTTLAQKARAGKLKVAEMEGGCFSISSLGAIGGVGFTPIINAPELAILGAAKARRLPRCEGEKSVPRLILPLCLSWDHRVVDGAAAGRFLTHLCSLLQDVRRWVL